MIAAPSIYNQELNFRIINSTSDLFSEIYFNQNACINSIDRKCIELENYQYFLSLDLEIANINYPESTFNYEVEVTMISKKSSRSLSRIFFFEKLDNFSELLNKIITLPFRVLGYFNHTIKKITLLEYYDNSKQPLEKLELLIKSKDINIKQGIFNFVPKIGYFRRIFSLLRFFVIPILFFIIIIFQLLVYGTLAFFFAKSDTKL